MSFLKRSSLVDLIRAALVVLIILAAMASGGFCGRSLPLMKEKELKIMLGIQLPRGPVVPSGPSVCHNKLDLYQQAQHSYPSDYIICP
ncbi:hypothetical protein U1Q18_002161 [Sarracenia purpurea var. burkii]